MNHSNGLQITNEIKKILKKIVSHAINIRNSCRSFATSELSQGLIVLRTYLRQLNKKYIIIDEDNTVDLLIILDTCIQVFLITVLFAWIKNRKSPSAEPFSLQKLPEYICLNEVTTDFTTKFYAQIPLEIRETELDPIEVYLRNQMVDLHAYPLLDLYATLYSDFLQLYDPKTWKALGVVYTPLPIVDFMIKGIDRVLKTHIGVSLGILATTVTYLDPSAGTMAFPCSLLSIAAQKLTDPQKNPQNLPLTFKEWFLNAFTPHFTAFEISLIPYLLGQLKLCIIAKELDNSLGNTALDLRFFQINTLLPNAENTVFKASNLPKNMQTALKIRDCETFQVILGNPPYNVSQQNKFEWIVTKVEDYKAGAQKAHSDSKQITSFKSLQNDYIKFVRLAQWIVAERQKSGLIAFITPNTYLNDLSTRGMRQSLIENFDLIWIIDLHGDVRRGIPFSEAQKGVTKDENVFDIKQGICLNFFFKSPDTKTSPQAQVKYCDVWGTQEEKLKFLSQPFENLPYTLLSPGEMNDYLFLPDIFQERQQYGQFFGLNEIFHENIQGIVTGHDALVSHPDRSILELNITNFYDGTFAKHEITDPHTNRRQFNMKGIRYQDVRDWSITNARKGDPDTEKQRIIPFMWRGFDVIWMVYSRFLLNGGTDRYPTMQYMLPHQQNLGLVVTRHSFRSAEHYSSCFISNVPISDGAIEGRIPCYIFPLTISATEKKDDFDHPKPTDHSNISEKFMHQLPYHQNIADRTILDYIYGVLHSSRYRQKYVAGLGQDFPRIPFPNSLAIFQEMAAFGMQLIALHLGSSENLVISGWSVSSSGNRKIISPDYDSSQQRIYFDIDSKKDTNTHFWIGQITPEMWAYEIGGIQQLEQWLKNRRYHETIIKGHLHRGLTNAELNQFLRICCAIKLTLALIPSVDRVYLKIEQDLFLR